MKYKKGKGGWAAMKLDLEKAFDKFEWNFLIIVLKCMGFDERWIQWISQCISTTSFSVLINGGPMGISNQKRVSAKVISFPLSCLLLPWKSCQSSSRIFILKEK
jgi:hypothetical protein